MPPNDIVQKMRCNRSTCFLSFRMLLLCFPYMFHGTEIIIPDHIQFEKMMLTYLFKHGKRKLFQSHSEHTRMFFL